MIKVVGLLARRTPMSAAGYVDDDYAGIRHSAMSYVGGQPHERDKVPVYPKNPDRYPNAKYVDCVNWTSSVAPDTARSTNSNTTAVGSTFPTRRPTRLSYRAKTAARPLELGLKSSTT